LVQKSIILLTEKQRSAIVDFLDNPPRRMSQSQRSLRFNLKDIDFDVLEEDLVKAKEDILLMRKFNEIEVPMGRATKEKVKDLKAQVHIRHTKVESEDNENVEN